MASSDGNPIWYELMTTDAEGAQAFYADVVGWSIADSGLPGTGDYRILTAPDGLGVGGLMALPEGAPMKPGWFAYIGVRDVDGTADRIRRLGGSVHMAPHYIPGVGRFAFVADPQGMRFYIMRGDNPDDSKAFGMAPGHCGWNELVTSDHKAALAFYGELFGWENEETMSMGEMGDYCFVDHAGQRLGAVMTAGAGWPTRWTYYFTVPSIEAAVEKVRAGGAGWPTRWTYYFTVPSIEAAVEKVRAGGGTIHRGPHEVPGGAWIIQGTDPQGAAFALTGGK